jgi:predicted nucleic acid-binding protein
MILVDTSVWIDHLRQGEPRLAENLNAGRVRVHPFVIGELALGSLRQRDVVLGALKNLPPVEVATDEEVFAFIEGDALFGLGIGFVDAHLLAAVKLTPGVRLWTRDRRLATVADRLGLGTAWTN